MATEQKTKWTPGPWHPDDDGRVWRRDPSELYQNGGGVAGDHPVAFASAGPVEWDNKFPKEANARLIAAAPEMYEALKDAIAGLRYIRQNHGGLYGVGWDRVEAKATTALAQATGEESNPRAKE